MLLDVGVAVVVDVFDAVVDDDADTEIGDCSQPPTTTALNVGRLSDVVSVANADGPPVIGAISRTLYTGLYEDGELGLLNDLPTSPTGVLHKLRLAVL